MKSAIKILFMQTMASRSLYIRIQHYRRGLIEVEYNFKKF